LSTILPLLAAAMGAIIGALANGWFRDWEAKKLTGRERLGLLNLVGSEIKLNDSLLEVFVKQPVLIAPQTTAALRTDAWDDANARLAQLLPEDYFRVLARYYSQIYVLQVTVAAGVDVSEKVPENKRMSEDQQLEHRVENVRKAKERGEDASSLITEYRTVAK
jgi:hypothetical protein